MLRRPIVDMQSTFAKAIPAEYINQSHENHSWLIFISFSWEQSRDMCENKVASAIMENKQTYFISTLIGVIIV